MTYLLIKSIRQEFPAYKIVVETVTRPDSFLDLGVFNGLVDRFLDIDFRRTNPRRLSRYNMVINLPGGGLQDPGDARGYVMLEEAEYCAAHSISHVMSGHSFHPSFNNQSLRNSFVVCREPASSKVLEDDGVKHLLTADITFAFEFPKFGHSNKEYTLLILRHDHHQGFRIQDGCVIVEGRAVPIVGPLLVSSSDHVRDYPKIRAVLQEYQIDYLQPRNLSHFLSIVASARALITDRYHPAIFSSAYGVPLTFLQRTGSCRDAGLASLLAHQSWDDLVLKGKLAIDSVLREIYKSAM